MIGFAGLDCANICEYSPCENNATCSVDKSNKRGYKCSCQGDTSGNIPNHLIVVIVVAAAAISV